MFLFKKWYTKLFLIIFLFCAINSKAQQKLTLESLVPPAPNAAELGKYGTLPVGTLTGIPDISFPLYEISSGSLKLPITLSYHAAGVQVNQRATDVGLNWSVNAGGQISRTVYGAKDEGQYGYFNYTPPTYAQLLGITSFYTMQLYSNPGYDLEPDLFVYNIGGKSGKFFYSQDNAFQTIPFEPVIVQKVPQGGNEVAFKITDDNGTIYNFENYGRTLSDIRPQLNTRSTWYLSSIVSSDYTDTISFTYETIYITDEFKQQSYPIGKEIAIVNNLPERRFVKGDNYGLPIDYIVSNSYTELVIKKILFKDGNIEFKRNNSRLDSWPSGNKMLDEIIVCNKTGQMIKKITLNHSYYLSNANPTFWTQYRLKLTGFSEMGSDTNYKSSHHFDYDPTTLPNYGSFALDYWGYYNGTDYNNTLIPSTTVLAYEINNISFGSYSFSNEFINLYDSWSIGGANREPNALFMQAGILTKITYPTGGYSKLEFEPNKYLSDEYIKQSIIKGGSTTGINKFTKSQTSYNFTFPSDASLAAMNLSPILTNLNIVFSVSNLGNMEFGETQLVTLTNNTNNTSQSWKHEGDLTLPLTVNAQVVLLPNCSYTLKNEVYGDNTVTISSNISWNENTAQHSVKTGGGLRIKAIKSYLNNNILTKQETYKYGLNGYGTKIFDERNFYRNYEDVVTFYMFCGWYPDTPGATGTYWQRKYLGISKYNTLSYLGSPVLYPYVTKYEGDENNNAGWTVYHYNILQEQISMPDEFINSGNYGAINTVWNQGELLDMTSFTKNNTPVTKTIYEYSQYDLVTRSGIQVKQFKQISLSGNCYSLALSDGYFSMYEYPIKTGSSRKTKETQIVYSQLNPSDYTTTITNYQYQNSKNRYVTQALVSTSEGDNIQKLTKLKYPNDTTDAVSVAMVSKNILTPVLEEKTYKSVSGSNTLLNTLQTTYVILGNLIVKSNIKASTGLLNPEVRITFDKYDQSTGNILQQSKSDDIKQSYIWGYNNTYPVVKAEGISYDNIPSSIVANIASHSFSNGTTYSATKNDVAYLKGQLSGLIRDTLMVTFYTYAPLVGMTSQTDPKGITTYYEYNTLMQLDRVLDDKGNILKEYKYHFYNQPSPITIYYNVAMSQVFTRQTCAVGTLPDTYTYSVAANTYSSEISQTDANTKAQNDINTNGQNAANANAICYYINPSSTTLSYPETGGTQYVTVTSNLTYTITSNSGWITVSPSSISGNGTLTIVCSTNSGVARSGTVTLQYSGSKGILTKVITINQAIASYISANPTSLTFNFITGELKTVAVSSVATWSVLSTTGGFITATKLNSTTLQVQCTANTKTTARTGTVTITNGINQVIINVTQYGKGGPTNSPVQSGG